MYISLWIQAILGSTKNLFSSKPITESTNNMGHFGKTWHFNLDSVADSKLKPLHDTFVHLNWKAVYELDAKFALSYSNRSAEACSRIVSPF
jgi:hypothetical protein